MVRYRTAEMEIVKITPLDMIEESKTVCVIDRVAGKFEDIPICNTNLPECGGFEIEID